MKITADRPQLADALTWVAQTLTRNPQSPVLACIRLTVTEAGIVAEATDWEQWVRADVTCLVHDGEVGDSLALPGLRLAAIVAALAGPEVVIDQDEPGSTVTVSAGKRSRYTLAPLADVHDWPKPPDPGPVVAQCDAQALAGAFSRVAVAVDPDSSRHQLQAMSMRASFDDGSIDLAGSDAYRAAGIAIDADVTEQADALLPVRRVGHVLKGMKGDLSVHTNTHGLIGLVTATRSATIRGPAEAGSGDLRKVLASPVTDPIVVTVDRVELVEAVKRSLLAAGWIGAGDKGATKVRQLVVEYAENGTLSVTSTDHDASGDEQVDASGEKPVRAIFNAEYLLDALGAVVGSRVRLTMPPSGLKATAVESADDPPLDDYRHLLMPVDTRKARK